MVRLIDNFVFQSHGAEFPTIFQIAMDYLPIQASSVPCERAFSSSAETDTARRNRISPLLMEALQMYKFGLKTDLMNFTAGNMTSENDLLEDNTIRSRNLLGELFSSSRPDEREDVMDNIIRAIE